MAAGPALSVVIVSWNTRDVLADCLASVTAGRHDVDIEIEVIVVDNASSDGSAEMVRRRFPSVEVIENRDNRGFASANNQALARTRGRHVLLLNPDTVVLGDVLAESVRYLDEHADVGALGCRVLNRDGTVQPTCFAFPSLWYLVLVLTGLHRLSWPRWAGRHHLRGWQRDDARDVEVVTGCYLMVRRRTLDHVGPLDDAFFLYGEETDWCRRIGAAGWRVRFAPVGEIVHLGGASAARLDERRELLLGEALVRLQRKHVGRAAAAAAWALLLARHLTRGHWRVVRRFAEAWPSAGLPSGR